MSFLSVFLFFFLSAVIHPIPDDGLESRILFLSGASSLEELDEDEYDRFVSLASHPLKINLASRERLLSCGLMSRYQAVSLLEYRKESGDILSSFELAAIDGFSKEYADALSVFLDFTTYAVVGHPSVRESSLAVESRTRVEAKDGTGYLEKLRIGNADTFDCSVSFRRHCDRTFSWPDTYCGSISWHGRGWTVVAGDCNSRFGQGLGLWSGFSLSGIPSVNTYSRNPTGISPYRGTSLSSHHGIAVSRESGFLKMTALYDFRNKVGAANLSLFLKNGQVSSTVSVFQHNIRPAVDARWNIKGLEIFAECAWDMAGKAPAAIAGCVFGRSDRFSLGTSVRYYDRDFDPILTGAMRTSSKCSDETGISLSAEIHGKKWVRTSDPSSFMSRRKSSLSISFDVMEKPGNFPDWGEWRMKGLAVWTWLPSPSWSSVSRIAVKCTGTGSPAKMETREELGWDNGKWILKGRADWVHCVSDSFLIYLEQGLRAGGASVLIREEVYRADNWDDRIYVYERDVPGCFNVPVCYGRGLSFSSLVCHPLGKWGKLWFKASYRLCERNGELTRKPEVRMQLDIRTWPVLSERHKKRQKSSGREK